MRYMHLRAYTRVNSTIYTSNILHIAIADVYTFLFTGFRALHILQTYIRALTALWGSDLKASKLPGGFSTYVPSLYI